MYELYVFPHAQDARNAGFRNGRHVDHRNLLAWWPDMGEDALRSMVLGRVTVSDNARRWTVGDANLQEKLFRGLTIIRSRMRDDPGIWIDL